MRPLCRDCAVCVAVLTQWGTRHTRAFLSTLVHSFYQLWNLKGLLVPHPRRHTVRSRVSSSLRHEPRCSRLKVTELPTNITTVRDEKGIELWWASNRFRRPAQKSNLSKQMWSCLNSRSVKNNDRSRPVILFSDWEWKYDLKWGNI